MQAHPCQKDRTISTKTFCQRSRRTTCSAPGRGCSTRQHSQQLCGAATRAALLYDFHDQLIPYEQAWSWQKQRVTELCSADTSDRRDTVFLLQHPPVYTLGAGSNESHVQFDLDSPPHPLYRTERGGEVTYHGPGQLVMYPILDLTQHTQDLHWYLRGLEEVIIRALSDTSGLQASRIPGLTGVWVDGCKLAAIGVRARKWVTYHGLALNVSTVLEPFKVITPCGIADRPVGSVKSALQRAASQRGQWLLQEQDHVAGADATDAGTSGQCSGSSNGCTFDSSAVCSAPGLNDSSQSVSSRSQAQQPAEQQQLLLSVSQDPLIVEYRYALVEALQDVFGLQMATASEEQIQRLKSSSASDALLGLEASAGTTA